MGDQFRDAWQSINWADEQTNLLKGEIDEFIEGSPYAVIAEPYADNRGGDIVLTPLKKPTQMLWAMRVGTVVDLLRAALNYAVYQYALIDCPAKAGHVEFPIFATAAQFRRSGRISYLAQNKKDLIESMQPYHGQTDALMWLHELARVHRHRLIRPVLEGADELHITTRATEGDPMDIKIEPGDSKWLIPENRTVLCRWVNVRPDRTHALIEANLDVVFIVDDPVVGVRQLPSLLFLMCHLTRDLMTAMESLLP